jgi:hypothetical protein
MRRPSRLITFHRVLAGLARSATLHSQLAIEAFISCEAGECVLADFVCAGCVDHGIVGEAMNGGVDGGDLGSGSA